MAEQNNKKGVGTLDSIFLGIGGTSPALSIAAASAGLIAVAGNLAPASILYSGLIIFGITLSFIHLNNLRVDDGASFTWVSSVLGKPIGFLAGWAVLLASIIYLVSAATPAATGILSLVAPEYGEDSTVVSILGIFILTLISLIIFRGIRFASRIETYVTGLSIVTMVAIIFAAAYHLIVYSNNTLPSFTLSGFTLESFVSSTLIALFFFWGWDVALNVGEETHGSKKMLARNVSIVVLFVATLTILSLMAISATLSPEQIQQSGANVIFDVANTLFPKPFGSLAIITILLSSIGAIEASVLQFVKTLFAMSKEGALHTRYLGIYKRWNSPWVALLTIWAASTTLFLLSAHSHTAGYIIRASINAICLQVAFYYSLTGFACAWHYRTHIYSIVDILGKILWPLLSSIFLIIIAFLSLKTLDTPTIAIGFGSLLFGIVPYYLNKRNLKK